MTDPGPYADRLDGLPTDIGALCEVVQGQLLHIFWAERYGVTLSDARKQEVQIRPVAEKLARIQAVDARPLTVARPPEKRLVGNCRDFSVLLCAILKHQGVPARARCGFGTYFMPDHYEDHWVCEYWNAAESRWVLVDAQLDGIQRKALKIGFDPLDVPRNAFVVGGQAWQMCREGRADPEKFGIFDMHGMWFIRGDLVRDFLALNQIEILPWDDWPLIAKRPEDLTDDDMALLDQIAALSVSAESAYEQIRMIYASDPRLTMPPDWPPEQNPQLPAS
jgi:hypothetical protein